jgi:hypothetical protein
MEQLTDMGRDTKFAEPAPSMQDAGGTRELLWRSVVSSNW